MAAAIYLDGDRRVSTQRRASLPAMMPMHPEGQYAEPYHRRWSTMPTVYGPENLYSTYPENLEVLETKDVVIVVENESAFFECKINRELNPTCTWHRNGIQINEDQKTTIKNDGEWQRLYLKDVELFDHGLYILECRHLDRYISVPHRLFVYPKGNFYRVFHYRQDYLKMGVQKHLTNTRVLVGETLEMVATFEYDMKKYFWYKDNEELHDDSRITMNDQATRASLTIKDAIPSDTGIYYVMAISDNGYFSSFADVIVGKLDEKRPLLPFMEENPPEDVEGYIGEDIQISAKVQIDACTKIRWMKNNAIIVTNEIQQIDFGNNYIGLRIPSPNLSSAGEYNLLMSNTAIGHVVEAPLSVTVTEPPPSFPTEVIVVRKLESAVACCGAQVSFDCRFDLEDITYFYVVWHVGPYKVERTNSLFSVICGRDHFLLYIKRFDPSMAGEVICELRRAHTNRASVKVSCAYAHLTCVPPCVISDSHGINLVSKLVQSPLIPRGAEFEGNLGARFHSAQPSRSLWTKMLDCGMNLICCAGLTRSATTFGFFQQNAGAFLSAEFCLHIIVCKLGHDGLYYWDCSSQGNAQQRVISIDICENVNVDESITTLVTWRDTEASANFCYLIEMEQQDGTFAMIGNTHQPCFWLNSLPIDRIMVFQITEDIPMPFVEHSEVVIYPVPEAMVRAPCSLERQYEEDFNDLYYKTNNNIGCGSFGNVALVQNKITKTYYAAKTVKARRTGRWRDNPLREFYIMRSLSHPKIIKLLGFYEAQYTYIFVMEYCWGGELFDRVVEEDYMREVDVVQYVRQICEALDYLCGVGIVHLDIKPENIICINPNSTNVKIIDFGVARELSEITPRNIYGTKEYVAPEILDYEEISSFSDMWSVGVVTFVLLSGVMPFSGNSWYHRSINICTATYDYDDEAFDEVSDLAMDFVDGLLVRRPQDRMSAAVALNHKWLKEGPPEGAGSKRLIKMRQNMKSYLKEYKQRWQFYISQNDLQKSLSDF